MNDENRKMRTTPCAIGGFDVVESYTELNSHCKHIFTYIVFDLHPKKA